MNLIISTSVNSALPMPIFCSIGTKISLGFHLVFVKAFKNFIDFTQDKKMALPFLNLDIYLKEQQRWILEVHRIYNTTKDEKSPLRLQEI